MTITELKKRVNIVDVIERYGIQLRPRGVEMVGLCPFHMDSRPSLTVNVKKQVFLCPVCDTKGDVFDFVMAKEGCTVNEAKDRISGNNYTPYTPPAHTAKPGTPQEWKQITPAPSPAQIVHHIHGRPSMVWEYRNSDNDLLGLICRFDTSTGKEIVPYTYRENTSTGRRMWMFRGFDRPRPVYNLRAIAIRKTAIITVVEGEKTADAAQRLLPKTVATCWQGGAKAYLAADWGYVAGRRFVLWPDNDIPGVESMLALAKILIDRGASDVKVVLPIQGKPKGWDLADAEADGMTADEIRAYTLANLHAYDSPIWADWLNNANAAKQAQILPQAATIEPPLPDTPKEPTHSIGQTLPKETAGNNRYYEVLGFQRDGGKQSFAFYIKAARIVVQYAASSLGAKTTLITLAPLDYWEDNFPLPKRSAGGFSIEMAVQVLIAFANDRGVFSPRLLRGRGAWFDAGRVVLHLGTHLLVNGNRVSLGSLATRYVYEAGEPMEMQTAQPLQTAQAVKLMDVAKLLNWTREIDAYLLAGWCVIAPFCGALRWRPHIWVTGGAGTGKSWVFREIVRRLLGSACLAVQSETSEAGLRQILASDAIPVVFDEAEGETRHALERMEHVLALMRAASSTDGGIVAKGTAFGRGQTFEIRSCFACASINSPVTLQADRTRVTNLVLTEPSPDVRATRWEALQRVYAATITDEWVAGLQARTLALLPTILKNADVFAAAVAALLGQQRIGDQLGIMLAGAYSLHRTGAVSYDEAMQFVQAKDWNEERQLKDTKDEMHLLATMAEKMVRVDGGEGPPVERNLGELVRIAAGLELDSRLTVEVSQARLKRLGFKVDGDYLLVSTSSDQMRSWMRDTAWAKNFHRTLMRVPGAEMKDSVRFASGMQTRAVKVPLSYFK
jgi:putative DNA primase/helicase